jgi:Mrp family chromosome partitioning ATPase
MDTTSSAAEAGRLTRAQVAKILSISVAGVRRREGKTLHPELGPKGERLFDAAEVKAMRQTMANYPQPPKPEPVEAGEEPASEPVALVVTGKAGVAATTTTTAAAADTSGDMAARAFELFEVGKTPAQVVIETRMSPEAVEKLYASWLRLRAVDTTSTGAQSQLDELNGNVEGLRALLAIRCGEHGREIARLAGQLRDLETRLQDVEAQPEVSELREMHQTLLGSILALGQREVAAERKLEWCVQMLQAMTGRRYG